MNRLKSGSGRGKLVAEAFVHSRFRKACGGEAEGCFEMWGRNNWTDYRRDSRELGVAGL